MIDGVGQRVSDSLAQVADSERYIGRAHKLGRLHHGAPWSCLVTTPGGRFGLDRHWCRWPAGGAPPQRRAVFTIWVARGGRENSGQCAPACPPEGQGAETGRGPKIAGANIGVGVLGGVFGGETDFGAGVAL